MHFRLVFLRLSRQKRPRSGSLLTFPNRPETLPLSMGFLRSDFLFSSTGFLMGVGSAIAIGGNYYSFNRSRTPEVADSCAMAADFGVVGNDLRATAEAERLKKDQALPSSGSNDES